MRIRSHIRNLALSHKMGPVMQKPADPYHIKWVPPKFDVFCLFISCDEFLSDSTTVSVSPMIWNLNLKFLTTLSRPYKIFCTPILRVIFIMKLSEIGPHVTSAKSTRAFLIEKGILYANYLLHAAIVAGLWLLSDIQRVTVCVLGRWMVFILPCCLVIWTSLCGGSASGKATMKRSKTFLMT